MALLLSNLVFLFFVPVNKRRDNYMLNFAICDDNINILDKLEKMLENIFTKNNFDATVSLPVPLSPSITKKAIYISLLFLPLL